ncbi:ROK family transcriptional regulator [Thermoactinospora rubra]|uniref:ROK family transcriptional regulator n=1 Tax=Thermoactinospora rubra TaxID=1088767 RepID=UPI000A11E43C|nr:ROK family transcriptional regulator [Thermoactinospora rubra]
MPRRASRRVPITSRATAQVFTTVLARGPVPRTEIARLTGLSSGAVTKAARPLVEAGYLEEVPVEAPVGRGAGRPASPLAIRADREFFAGVKITTDELIGVLADLRCQVRTRVHRPLSSNEVMDVVAALGEVVTELCEASPDYAGRVHCLGVAVSGDVDKERGFVRYSPFLRWREVPLGALVAEVTGLTVTLENDVKALAVAEHLFGAGAGTANFALLTIGTGIGCALVVNGSLVAGANGVAGEIGHVPVSGDGPDCHCGGTGCVEAIAATQAIVEAARAVTGQADLSIDQAVWRARDGDAAVQEVFRRAGEAIGRGLAAMANLIGPEKIVVSGEGVAAYDLFEKPIRTAFARQAFGAAAYCPIVVDPLPFDEWARGAAAVAVQEFIFPGGGKGLR